jgi:hypothetical protein
MIGGVVGRTGGIVTEGQCGAAVGCGTGGPVETGGVGAGLGRPVRVGRAGGPALGRSASSTGAGALSGRLGAAGGAATTAGVFRAGGPADGDGACSGPAWWGVSQSTSPSAADRAADAAPVMTSPRVIRTLVTWPPGGW